jgi:predicted membrane protein
MTKNAALAIIAVILGAMVLMWVLKIAFKLIIFGVVAAAAVAAFYAVKSRIGGPRA